MFGLPHLIQSVSCAGIPGMVFAESGLLIGFSLPDDSLLITAGLLELAGHLAPVLLITVAGVIIGDSVGYAIGRRSGPGVFTRPESRLYKPEYVERTHAFFDRHGSRALIMARFVPVVGTAAPTLAGVGQMKSTHFLAYTAVGGLLWALTVPLLGYALGSVVPNLDRSILLDVDTVAVSINPPAPGGGA